MIRDDAGVRPCASMLRFSSRRRLALVVALLTCAAGRSSSAVNSEPDAGASDASDERQGTTQRLGPAPAVSPDRSTSAAPAGVARTPIVRYSSGMKRGRPLRSVGPVWTREAAEALVSGWRSSNALSR